MASSDTYEMAEPDPYHVNMEEIEQWRSKMIANQIKMLDNVDYAKFEEPKDSDDKDDMDDIDFLIENCQRKIKEYTITDELNKDTQECLKEMLSGMEDDRNEDLEAELLAAKKRQALAKRQLDYVLRTYYPDLHADIQDILRKVEMVHCEEEEENRYVQIADNNIESLLILQSALCIVQHPEKMDFYKLAPLY